MHHRTCWIVCLSLTAIVLLAACGSSTPAPTPTAAPTETSVPPAATSTALPTPTETPQPTATSMPAPTATPSATATPLATTTPKAPATLKSPPTPRATAVPATPAPTTAPVAASGAASGAVPPPQVFQFSGDGFRQYLDYAHVKYQAFLAEFGSVAKGDHAGSCNWFFQRRNELLGIVALTGAPEPWTAMVEEYNSFRTQTLAVIEPLNALCGGGGGAIPEGLDRQITDLFDRAQNRMYEMLNQAKTMP
jgi:hypothetical protein